MSGNHAKVNGLELYYEIHGQGEPLILLHGGLGSTGMFAGLIPQLSGRQVIAVDLQAHGRTADIDRPMRYELMADDIAALIQYLGLNHADVMGYSLGAGTALRTVIQHPELIRKLVLVSTPFKRSGWFPEVLVGMDQMGPQAAEMMKPSPIYQEYARIAPRPEDFPRLIEKVGDLLRQDYDLSVQVAHIKSPTLLVFADSDSIPVTHMAEFFALLGGGKQDAGWDGSRISPSRLAVLPGMTHYNILMSPVLASYMISFLDEK